MKDKQQGSNKEKHVIIVAKDKKIHAIPVEFFREYLKGKVRIEELEGWEKILPSIISEWLDHTVEDWK